MSKEVHDKVEDFLNHFSSLEDVPDHLFLTRDKAFTRDKIKAGKSVTDL